MLICPNCHKGKFESEWGTFSAICKSCENELKDKVSLNLASCVLCDVEYKQEYMDIFQSKFICKDCVKELKEEF